MSKINEVIIPILEESKKIHPAVDFDDENIYLGVWLDSKTEENENIFKYFYMLKFNGENLQIIPLNKLIENNILITTNLIKNNNINFDLGLVRCNNPKELIVLFSQILNRVEFVEFSEFPIYILYICDFSNNNNINNKEKMYNIYVENKQSIQTLLQILFKIIKHKFCYYIDTNEEDNKFYALWAIGTYFHQLFKSYPYIYLQGTKRSGKTTVIDVMSKICFNAIQAGNVTTSSVFRIINSMRPTFLIDEQDALCSEQNKPELRQILLNGYKKGAKVIRSTQKGAKVDFSVEEFEIYCPKMIVNIAGLDDAIMDRAIWFTILRTKNKVFGDRSIKIESDNWKDIRTLCYISMLLCWKLVKETYDNLENDTKLISRDWEKWKPILALAKLCGVYDEMKNFAEMKSQEHIIEDVSEQKDTLLIKCLFENVKENNYYKLSEIRMWFLQYFESEEKWLNSKWLGRALKRLKFLDKRTVAGKREYFLSVEKIKDLAERFLFENYKEEKEEILQPQNIYEQAKQLIIKKCANGCHIDELRSALRELTGTEYIGFEVYSYMKKLGQINKIGDMIYLSEMPVENEEVKK